MKKKLIAVPALCGAALFLLCGCFSGDNARDDLLNYLENRYPDDDFVWDHDVGSVSRANDFDYIMTVHSQKFPKDFIYVRRWLLDGQELYADNYMVHYLHDDIESCMHDIAEDVFGACKVYMTFTPDAMVSPAVTVSATAEDYLKSNPDCGFAVYLPPDGISADEAKAGIPALEAELSDRQFYSADGGVRIITDQDVYDKITSFDGPPGGFMNNPFVEFVGKFEVKQSEK